MEYKEEGEHSFDWRQRAHRQGRRFSGVSLFSQSSLSVHFSVSGDHASLSVFFVSTMPTHLSHSPVPLKGFTKRHSTFWRLESRDLCTFPVYAFGREMIDFCFLHFTSLFRSVRTAKSLRTRVKFVTTADGLFRLLTYFFSYFSLSLLCE